MSNIGYGKALTITNMKMIITEIGCRFSQSCKIRHNILVRTNVREPSRSRNITNNKMGRRLLSIATKLSVLSGFMAEGEVELTLDVLLKRLVRRPLWRTRWPFVLLPVALLSVSGSIALKAMKIRVVLVVVEVAVGMQLPQEQPLLQLKLGYFILFFNIGQDGHKAVKMTWEVEVG